MSITEKVEKNLILHCAPTLASLKTASLFTLEYSCRNELNKALREWNLSLSDKGIAMLALRESGSRALIYVFRRSHLKRALSSPETADFLKAFGYSGRSIGSVLSTLRSHLENAGEFPHEIGIFLGYPVGDVIGFIENKGQNFKCCGCRKVYCDECEAGKTFARYKKCERVYLRLSRQGRSVRQLTVTA